jgi:hypothetical protein
VVANVGQGGSFANMQVTVSDIVTTKRDASGGKCGSAGGVPGTRNCSGALPVVSLPLDWSRPVQEVSRAYTEAALQIGRGVGAEVVGELRRDLPHVLVRDLLADSQ